jgi:hypothetical protein
MSGDETGTEGVQNKGKAALQYVKVRSQGSAACCFEFAAEDGSMMVRQSRQDS